jgi:hypothetical protein
MSLNLISYYNPIIDPTNQNFASAPERTPLVSKAKNYIKIGVLETTNIWDDFSFEVPGGEHTAWEFQMKVLYTNFCLGSSSIKVFQPKALRTVKGILTRA